MQMDSFPTNEDDIFVCPQNNMHDETRKEFFWGKETEETEKYSVQGEAIKRKL